MGNGGHGGEKLHRLVHFHLQHSPHRFAAPLHRQGLWIKARTIAHFAGHFDIGQKAHGHGAHALALASGATPSTRVKAKARSGVAPGFGLVGLRKKFAYRIPKTDIGGRARTRGFAYGGLIDFEHAIELLPTRYARTMLPRCAAFAVDGRLHIGQQHIACQCGFARTRNASHHHQLLQRYLHAQALQIVEPGLLDLEVFLGF